MVSPGRAELSLFNGNEAIFVFVLMSGAARASEGSETRPSRAKANAIAWRDDLRVVQRGTGRSPSLQVFAADRSNIEGQGVFKGVVFPNKSQAFDFSSGDWKAVSILEALSNASRQWTSSK